MAATPDVTVTLTRTKALALARAAETGIAVAKVLGLIQNPTTTEEAIDALNVAIRGGGK
jgi:hypothetical protein